MKSAFFGQYLLNKGLINAQQLIKALNEQEALNKRLGDLALEKKMLNEEQIKKISELQKKDDIFFGEGAKKLGYLSQEQIDNLLQIQKEKHLYIGDALVSLGYLTKQQRDEALADFIIEQNESSKIIAPFISSETLSKQRPFIEQFTSCTIKLLQRMSGIYVKFDQYEIKEKETPLEAISVQADLIDPEGKCIMRYILLLGEETAKSIYVKICKHDNIKTEDVSPREIFYELTNIICGISCANLQSAARLTTSVPKILSDESRCALNENEKTILVSLITTYGQIKFMLVF